MDSSLDALPDDPATLKAMIIAQRAEADRMAASVRAYEALVQALRIRIARLKKQKFGASSEKIEREIDQLQLALEDLEVAIAAAAEPPEPDTPAAATSRAAPRRRGKPRITGPSRASASCWTRASVAPTAAAFCAWSARICRRSWTSSPPG